ncbi:MAG: tripartite tricarboxylate transporter substrate binding protein BugE [Burkholderiaceae bacterium]|nr:tripartite tricarboxylate transporter substrate binding protein BugE [Burkholderiaceae bacterium]
MRFIFNAIYAVIVSIASLTTASAQSNWPGNKPIKLIIPFPPGGTTDIVGRLVSQELSKQLGTSVVIENRGGGGGSIGALEVARAAPDGYTLGMGTVSTLAVNPACNPKLAYDPIKDFAPISNLAHTANVIVVHPKVPAQDMKEFIALLKKNPGKYSFATSGTCGIAHMMGEQFKVSTGTYMLHIPYRGSGPALNDTLAGQVEVMLDNLPSSMPHIAAGKLRPLAIAWTKRLDALPTVPTYSELGLKEMNDPAWYGLLAPAGTPREIIAKIQAAANKAVFDPAIAKRLREAGAEPVGNTPEQFADEIKKEREKMLALVKRQNIKFE